MTEKSPDKAAQEISECIEKLRRDVQEINSKLRLLDLKMSNDAHDALKQINNTLNKIVKSSGGDV